MHRLLQTAAAIALITLAGAAPQSLHIVNVMPAFWEAWDSTQGQPEQIRVEKFKELVVQPNMAVYGFDEFSHNLQSDENIASYLQGLAPRINDIRTVSDRFEKELPADEAAFSAALPDFDSKGVVIYFMPSFGHFLGQTHDLGSKTGVLFGLDRMGELRDLNPGVIVSHELYHIYQYEKHPGYKSSDAVLWQAVWGEGSAAYASQVLTPDATEEQALSPQLAQTSPDAVKQLACGIESQWASHDYDVFGSYLDAGQHPAGLPPMGGYLIGYLVARDLSHTYSVGQMAALQVSEVETLMRPRIDLLCKTGSLAGV